MQYKRLVCVKFLGQVKLPVNKLFLMTERKQDRKEQEGEQTYISSFLQGDDG